jgi:RNA polymerase sigma-70 factor (ECF subfamily)
MLRGLGVPEDESDQIAINHRLAGLPAADTALLDFALQLTQNPSAYGPSDIDSLQRQGFTETHVLETIVMSALTSFLNTVQMGLGPMPDFKPRRVFAGSEVGFGAAEPVALQRLKPFLWLENQTTGDLAGGLPERSTDTGIALLAEDPDRQLVERARKGDLDAFEELVHRHAGRLFRTLVTIAANPQDAEDDVQNAFLKAFVHLRGFKGNSRFSTWLTRIAINERLQRLRGQKKVERLDADATEEAAIRPGLLRAWEDPEQMYSRVELRSLIERELLKLPLKYRSILVLRDMQQFSTAEAAAILDESTANVKTRLHRARLMLREALAPYFVSGSAARV